MHSYKFQRLPFSFNEIWQTNRIRHPERPLRNDDELFIPPYRIELVKRLPLVEFPTAWNNERSIENTNPVQHVFLKNVKKVLLSNILQD